MTPPDRPSILRESPDRIGAIRDLLVSTFPTEVEAEVVNDLRDASAHRVALVAVDSDWVVGHAAFSPVSILPHYCLGYVLIRTSVAHIDFASRDDAPNTGSIHPTNGATCGRNRST